MARLLLFLPICLFLQDRRCQDCTETAGEGGPVAQVASAYLPKASLPGQELFKCLSAAPFVPFPATIPWEPLREVSIRRQQAIEDLIRRDVPAFLQMCIDRYDAEVKAYSAIMQKRERVFSRLLPTEVVETHFREQPFSVFMNWRQGVGMAQRTLYVHGENGNRMLARPSGLLGNLGVFARDVDSREIKAAGRYIVTEFGMKLGTVRSLKPMLEARKRNALHVRYDGLYRVPETGDRLCYKIVRTPYDPPEDEGVNELTIYIDTETWLQVGSVLKDARGELIAEYYFRDIRLDPKFSQNQFSRSAL
ncbi:MAG: DUF1571 domain-containing protein [Planctomycetes bacterium]|nr:DUF1571 domain-containing protein [Planctomycetota bacterium]